MNRTAELLAAHSRAIDAVKQSWRRFDVADRDGESDTMRNHWASEYLDKCAALRDARDAMREVA